MTSVPSYCRICQASCGVLVDVDAGRIAAVRGDPDNPLSRGFTCPKGRRAGDLHHGAGRLLTSMARGHDGHLAPVDSERALDEIASRLSALVHEHGPGSVGLFVGTQAAYTTLTPGFARAWLRALGSPKVFSTMTIDQSAKWIAPLRMGQYQGGLQGFRDANVWMIVGANPLVSMSGVGAMTGFPLSDNLRRLREAKARGLTLIVIDPRRTETASYADIHLQIVPGTDALVLAGLLHLVFREGLVDTGFCDRYASNVAELRAAVASATPDAVAARCGITADQLIGAAHAFGRGPRGVASSGTGPDMAPHSNLSEHLLGCLNIVCGRFLREGEATNCPPVLGYRPPPRAMVTPPDRTWERGFRSRVGGYGQLHGELPTAILADEILEPGTDRLRALVVAGGNPAVAVPDQPRMVRALRELDLLVTIDPRMSATAQLADYVIAPTLFFERSDHTVGWEGTFATPFAQYATTVVAPPDGVIEDWEVFWGLAARMGVPLKFAGRMLDIDDKPSSEALLAMLAERGRVALDDVSGHPHGLLVDLEPQLVQPAMDPGETRLDLLPIDVAAELDSALEAPMPRGNHTHLLTVRRMREVMNSLGTDVDSMRGSTQNPAWLHPEDMAALGTADGDAIEIETDHARIFAFAAADTTMRRGVVSLTHCWGGLPDDGVEPASPGAGANPARLIPTDSQVESINRMPTMTAVPVRVRKVPPATA